MRQTKTVHLDTNWLDAINGLSVQKAIEYLSTLDPNHELSYYMEGDTHGCEVTSNLCYDIPMTNSEILTKLEEHYLKEIALYENAKQKHLRDNKIDRVDNCDRLLKQLYDKLEQARDKYT